MCLPRATNPLNILHQLSALKTYSLVVLVTFRVVSPYIPESGGVELDDGLRGHYIPVSVRVGNATNVGLPRWVYCGNSLCFLPTETEHEAPRMGYMAHWLQVLIRLHFSPGLQDTVGCCWLYDPENDASWFSELPAGI